MSKNQLSENGPSWMLPVVACDPASDPLAPIEAGVAGVSSVVPIAAVEGRAPTMEVASSFSSRAVPFGLDGPLDLLGGDRLGPTGVGFDLAMDWQPNLMRAIGYACDEQRLRGRDWFFMPPLVLRGPKGAGRTHVSRRIAAAAGVPYLEIDANEGAWMRHHARPNVEMPSPLIVGLAMTRCANPVVSVRNMATASNDRIERVCAMIDPSRNRRFVDEALGATLDLSAVTWLIDGTSADTIPGQLRHLVGWVDLVEPGEEAIGLLIVDLIAEAVADFDLPRPSTPDVLRMIEHFERGPGRRSACEIYWHVSRELGAVFEDPPF